MPDVSLLDLVALNNADPIIGLVESAVFSYPELGILDAIPHPGTSFKVGRRTVLPTAQFAQVGAGVPTSKSTFVLENKEMFLMNNQLEVPLDYISAQTRSVGDILSIEAEGVMNAAFYHLCQQLYYGNTGAYGGTGYVADPLGFPGYCQIINGDTNFNIQLGGTTGSCTSVYLVCAHEKGVSLAVGQDGNMQLLPWTQQQILVSGSGKTANKTLAMVSAFLGWFGMTAANEYSVFRLSGADGTTGKTITDKGIADLLALVPIQYRKGMHLFMNRQGAKQIQESRSAIAFQTADGSGRGAWSPQPTDSNGIPIIVTEAITNTETP